MMGFVLYRVFTSTGVLLYVGATTNPAARFQNHNQTRSWWLDAASITLEHFDNAEELFEAETRAIKSEKPRHNVIDCKPRAWTRKKRGPRGEGSVFLRNDGYWVAGIRIRTPDGKCKNKRFVSNDREKAVSRLEAFKLEMRSQGDG